MGADGVRWRLSGGVRLGHDPVRDVKVLLHPEGVLLLNATGAAVVALCDGHTDVSGIVKRLSRTYEPVVAQDVRSFLARLAERRLIEPARAPRARGPEQGDG
ncbi:pyrroloquinoline quinone biosynthesis peptide chaperone PqqD [Streptomyces cinnamoneus]|uniref:Pyrroloquinoline quinone biosynthesis peptide chaperone PqqD n=1 Tax=Streptomyces cinnamoneus TaxID=53446 RepID=A0A2G1XKG2_STRCJ|nr:pyrroloquinoline quinone biosynthesis peptide chaperone PqqD [Streptomyces cinnamoneus]PHQ51717.1 pyrroloquinoline quinone biosynthesis peptide chaperone PqqD [Streptomyces cinnamoneus]PPT11966.1 pyrroloquinoline quinone biosynthesis peptide chaperone PqqD [Streptomyces cinnamoneus]